MHTAKLLGFLAIAMAPAAWGSQIDLTSENVIGGSATLSGAWNGAGSGGWWNATHIFDIPSGTVPAGFEHWRCSGCGGTYITIDLGAAYVLSSAEFFNTYFLDNIFQGIRDFDLVAGDSVVYDTADLGYRLTGTTATILHGTLGFGSGDPVPGQVLGISGAGSYRYLELRPLSPPPPGALAYGLYQLRLSGDLGDVPEPATFGTIACGLAAGLMAVRRRARPRP